MRNFLYHGTSAEDYDPAFEIIYPFWVTLSFTKAERFSLRGTGKGERRVLAFEWANPPTHFFEYVSEQALFDATGEWFEGSDDTRYPALVKALTSQGYNGLVEAESLCIFRRGFLSYVEAMYLDRDDDYEE